MSNRLYSLLPDSLRPANRLQITPLEAQLILKKAFEIEGLGTKEYNEIDSLCYRFAPKYSSFPDRQQRQKYLYFVCNYLYNSYAVHTSNKTTLRGDGTEYKSPHARQGIAYADLFLKEDALRSKSEIDWKTNIWKGNVLMFKSHFEMELDLYKNALNTLQELIRLAANDPRLSGAKLSAFNAASFLFETLSLTEQAMAYADSADALCQILIKQSARKVEREWAYNYQFNLLQVKQKLYLKKFKEGGNQTDADSVTAIHEILKRERREEAKLFISSSFATLSALSYSKKAYRRAITYADSAFLVYEDFGNTAMGEQTIAIKGLSLMCLGEYDPGIRLLHTLRLEASTGTVLTEVLKALIKYETDKKNFATALKYSVISSNYQDRMYALDIQGKSLEMIEFYKAREREKQIAVLKQQQTRNAFVGALFSIIGFITLFWLVSRYRINKRKNNDLIKRLDEAIEMQSMQIEMARNAERKRIGQQLHDDLASTMAATLAYLKLKAADHTNELERTQHLRLSHELELSYEKARQKSHEMYLEDESEHFWSRLSSHIELLFSGTSVAFDFEGDITGVIIPPEIKTTLLMILKEAIANIVRHAKASRASIMLYYDQNNLVLEVNDNGKGFSGKVDKNSIGHRSIRQRVAEKGGIVEIITEEMNGTKLIITIPLRSLNDNLWKSS